MYYIVNASVFEFREFKKKKKLKNMGPLSWRHCEIKITSIYYMYLTF